MSRGKKCKQAGAELGQAQFKLALEVTIGTRTYAIISLKLYHLDISIPKSSTGSMQIHPFRLFFFFNSENVRIYIEILRLTKSSEFFCQPTNIPQKWFSTQKEPLNIRFQMKLTPTMVSVYFWKK